MRYLDWWVEYCSLFNWASSTNVFDEESHLLNMSGIQRTKELEEQIADLKRQWPAHSVPPAMLQKLDELEDELELECKKMENDNEDAQ